MSRLKTLFTLVMIASFVLTACGGGGGGGDVPIKVGAIFDLTGATGDVGTPYGNGVKGYVEWLNANGGVEGHQIELISADYAYKVDVAEQLYTQYVSEGVVAFMGWGTGDTEALRTKIAEDKIPFMSASYSAALTDMAVAPYNFLIGTTYSDQAIIAITWAMEDWAAKGNADKPKVALIHHDSPFGTSPVEDAKAFAEANSVEFTSLPMPGGVTDYVAELAQMTLFGADYVIVHTVSSPASVLLKDAKSQGFEAQFICLNWCADEILVNLAGDAAEGVVGTIPFAPPSSPVPGHKDASDFLAGKGTTLEAESLHYTQGWWTMAVMTEGIRRVIKEGKEVNGENIRAALETIANFSTGDVTSPITFSAASHKGNTSLQLFKVESGKWVKASDFISAK